MAALAALLAMFAFENESGLRAMVEALAIETGKYELRAIVFRMTTRAIRLTRGGFVHAGMISGVRFHSAPNLAMAFQTLEAAPARTRLVARRAFGHAFQLRVGWRQRTRRDLRRSM